MENELIQHTPEPWDYDDYEVFADGGEVFICVASKPNARRICAAVNATAGLTTEQLEFAAAENLKLDFQNRMKNLESEVEYLRSQNVQMRNALQGVCENIARATPTPRRHRSRRSPPAATIPGDRQPYPEIGGRDQGVKIRPVGHGRKRHN